MMYYRYDWMIPMLVGGLILVGLIILVIFLIMRYLKNTNDAGGSGYSGYSRTSGSEQPDPAARALSILAERYAKGEISDEEYRQKKAEILKP